MDSKHLEVVVLTPTRELANQVADEFWKFGSPLGHKVAKVVGGQNPMRQIEQVNAGTKTIVATPGRLLDHLQSNRFKNFSPKVVILDEADEMLDMGFIDDIKKILSYTPQSRQTLMFSATMPKEVKKLADNILNNPTNIQSEGLGDQHEDITQSLYVVKPKEKSEALYRLLRTEKIEKAIIFCRTKAETDELANNLHANGHKSQVLHGDLNQAARNHAIMKFKKGLCNLLVATDVAARGLDIPGVSHVFNFNLSANGERHTHRIGRTGRAGTKGKAITLVSPQEFKNDGFFRAYGREHFEFASIPTKDEALEATRAQLMRKVDRVKVSEEAQYLLDQIDGEERELFILKLLSMQLKQMASVTGPDAIGLSTDDIKRLASNIPSRGNGNRNKKPRGRSQQARKRAKSFSRDRNQGRSNAQPQRRARAGSAK